MTLLENAFFLTSFCQRSVNAKRSMVKHLEIIHSSMQIGGIWSWWLQLSGFVDRSAQLVFLASDCHPKTRLVMQQNQKHLLWKPSFSSGTALASVNQSAFTDRHGVFVA